MPFERLRRLDVRHTISEMRRSLALLLLGNEYEISKVKWETTARRIRRTIAFQNEKHEYADITEIGTPFEINDQRFHIFANLKEPEPNTTFYTDIFWIFDDQGNEVVKVHANKLPEHRGLEIEWLVGRLTSPYSTFFDSREMDSTTRERYKQFEYTAALTAICQILFERNYDGFIDSTTTGDSVDHKTQIGRVIHTFPDLIPIGKLGWVLPPSAKQNAEVFESDLATDHDFSWNQTASYLENNLKLGFEIENVYELEPLVHQGERFHVFLILPYADFPHPDIQHVAILQIFDTTGQEITSIYGELPPNAREYEVKYIARMPYSDHTYAQKILRSPTERREQERLALCQAAVESLATSEHFSQLLSKINQLWQGEMGESISAVSAISASLSNLTKPQKHK